MTARCADDVPDTTDHRWRIPAATETVAGGALALIAALTFPHAAVVGWMDREQAVFALTAGPGTSSRTAGG